MKGSYIVNSIGVNQRNWTVSTYSIDPIELGKKRNKLHHDIGNTTRRFYTDKNTEDVIGAYGEVAFGDMFNLPIDIELKPNGDSYDFLTHAGRIDVKTARKAYNLLVKVREINKTDILVLAHFDEEQKSITFLGWETANEMRKQPTKDFGYGIINYYKHNTLLRPMEELAKLLQPKDGKLLIKRDI